MPIAPNTYEYRKVGDCRIKADVYPPAAPRGPAPVLVFIHGGCLMYGSRRDLHPQQLELYRRAGYAVVAIDYRLAPETKLPGIIEDLEAAFRWIREKGPDLLAIDPDRVAVVGHSAGGYLTLMAGCRIMPRPQALVAFYGYGDIVAEWYAQPDPFYCRQPRVSEEESGCHVRGPVTSEMYAGRGKDKLYLYCRQRGLWPLEIGGHDPAQEPGFFVPYGPVRNVTADYPPTLLLHGTRDTDVPYSLSLQMAGELARRHVEHELITVEDGGHGFDGDMADPFVRDCFARVLAFLDRHIGVRPA